MLVLSRKKHESIMLGDDISLTVMEIRGDRVLLGIVAPHDTPVDRQEIRERSAATPFSAVEITLEQLAQDLSMANPNSGTKVRFTGEGGISQL